jgi:metal-dependent HD superfamily phosphatase/phosphodiesterase
MENHHAESFRLPPLPLYEAIRADGEFSELIMLADKYLGAIGFTEHGLRHAMKVGYFAALTLKQLGLPDEEVELAHIAGYLHDIGNFIARSNHGQTGAALLFGLLRAKHGLSLAQLAVVLSAVGNHEEQYGNIFNNVCAAVVIADKSDVHRTRVRNYDKNRHDIHDDVNYAVTQSNLSIDAAQHEIRLTLGIDTAISSVMDYFEIFLSRMTMCRSAAQFLGCKFVIVANGSLVG